MHELTEKIWKIALSSHLVKEHFDAAITTWLKEKACHKDINPDHTCHKCKSVDYCSCESVAHYKVFRKGDTFVHGDCGKDLRPGWDKPAEESKVTWCEHIYLNDISKSYIVKPIYPMPENGKFCPICSAPRPQEKSLRERLAEKMYEFYYKDQNLKWERAGIETEDYMELADTAISFLEQEGWHK